MNPILTEMRKHFDRCVVIGLNRINPFYERLGVEPRWRGRLNFQSALSGIQCFPAIDARKVKPPPYWANEIPALWACGESHRQVICRALSDDVQRLLIMEDDCAFVPDAAERMAAAMAQVPDLWDGLMFGGQVSCFDGRTRAHNDLWSSCVQVERLHCYALDRDGMQKFHDILCEPTSVANDYRWGDAQEDGRLIVYRCEPFIAYQTEGRSAISGRVEANRIWDDRVDVRLRDPATIPVVSIVCPFPVLERLRDAGIASNGGESPPFMSQIHPGAVENAERNVADTMMTAFDLGLPTANQAVLNLRSDAAFHRRGPLLLWHYERFIPFEGATRIRADTFEEAVEQLRGLGLIDPNE